MMASNTKSFRPVPLTDKQARDRASVVLAYADWWNHLKFKKGWATPLFSLNEVKDYLERAAEIVIGIRTLLDKEDPSFKVRMLDGSTREYFWSLKRKPTECPERFVRNVVHATLKDGRGYVEGLTEEKIDNFINQFDPALHANELHLLEKHEEFMSKIESTWESTSTVLQSYLKELRTPHAQLPTSDVAAEEKDCTKLIHQLTDLGEVVRGYTERAKRRRLMVDDSSLAAAENKKGKKKRNKKSSQSKHDSVGDHGESTEPEPQSATSNAEVGVPEVVPEVEEAHAMATDDQPASSAQEQQESSQQPMQHDGDETTTNNTTNNNNNTNSEQQQQQQQQQEPIVEEPDDDAQEEPISGRPDGHIDGEESGEEEHSHSGESDSESGHVSEEPPQNFTIKVQQVAAEVDQISKGVLELSENLHSLDDDRLTSDPNQASEVLRKLRGRCQQFTDSLLRDMTVLDALSLPEDQRHIRRTQILNIERLVDTVEDLTRRIKDMQTKLNEHKEKEAAQAKKEKATTPPPPPQQQQTNVTNTHTAAPSSVGPKDTLVDAEEQKLNALWKQLRLQVRLDVDETTEAYVIQGYVPGLKNEDIKVQLSSDGNALTVSGTRFPTPRELALMYRQLEREGMEGMENLLRLASGRYGTFSQQFRLPANANRDQISADYNNGVIRVVVPKRRISPQPRVAPARSVFGASPLQTRYPGSRPRNFLEDQDFWW